MATATPTQARNALIHTAFLRRLFTTVDGTVDGNVELRSFANPGETGTPRTLFTRDPKAIRAFVDEHDRPGRGVYLGTVSRLAAATAGTSDNVHMAPALWLDVDVRKDNLDAVKVLSALQNAECPPTLIDATGGGLHAWWQFEQPIDVSLETGAANRPRVVAALKRLAAIFAGDDKVCDLARVLRLPGSHNSKASVVAEYGAPFLVEIVDHTDTVYDLGDLERWLAETRVLIERPDRAEPSRPCQKTREGQQRRPQLSVAQALARLAGMAVGGTGDASVHQSQLDATWALSRHGWNADRALAAVLDATRELPGTDGWHWDREERDIAKMIATAVAKQSTHAAAEPSEDGLIAAFADQRRAQFRYDHGTKNWREFDDVRWQADETGMALDTIRQIAVASGETGPARRAMLKVGTWLAAERGARSREEFATTADAWDRNRFLMATPGGTVDLRTGQLRDADPADLITRRAGVAPGEGEATRWLQFLRESFAGPDGTARTVDEVAALIRFVEQFFGLCLSGDTSAEVFLNIYGPGKNGKSKLTGVLQLIFGDYFSAAAPGTFIASRTDHHPTEVARLNGPRLITSSEVGRGQAFNLALLKQFTGNDRVTARFMHGNFFEFEPQGKLVFVSNDQIATGDLDEAIGRRMLVLPFDQCPRVVDTHLSDKLAAEAPQIFARLITANLDRMKNGLSLPATVTAATREYLSSQDILGQWLDERCDLAPDYSVFSAALFADWTDFAKARGEFVGTQTRLTQSLMKRKFQSFQSGGRKLRGLKLKEQSNANPS